MKKPSVPQPSERLFVLTKIPQPRESKIVAAPSRRWTHNLHRRVYAQYLHFMPPPPRCLILNVQVLRWDAHLKVCVKEVSPRLVQSDGKYKLPVSHRIIKHLSNTESTYTPCMRMCMWRSKSAFATYSSSHIHMLATFCRWAPGGLSLLYPLAKHFWPRNELLLCVYLCVDTHAHALSLSSGLGSISVRHHPRPHHATYLHLESINRPAKHPGVGHEVLDDKDKRRIT